MAYGYTHREKEKKRISKCGKMLAISESKGREHRCS